MSALPDIVREDERFSTNWKLKCPEFTPKNCMLNEIINFSIIFFISWTHFLGNKYFPPPSTPTMSRQKEPDQKY
jgi:hypothetical protein